MELQRIIVATDESDAGREAVRTGMDLAAHARGQVTVMRAVTVQAIPASVGVALGGDGFGAETGGIEMERLDRWLHADVLPVAEPVQVELGIAFGVPSVEICRFAESQAGDVLVLGRKRRSQFTRLLLGDTADAVARRSRLPCLFVPPGAPPIRRILVALDGSDRGEVVMRTACEFGRAIGASCSVVTVEQAPQGESPELGRATPLTRSTRLEQRVQAMVAQACGQQCTSRVALDVRRGGVVEQVLAAVEETRPDLLAIGYHRGGPPGVIEAGSAARHLAHSAPCAVLTVPL
jgi:nucleotide-binding universal stress UspA family protein